MGITIPGVELPVYLVIGESEPQLFGTITTDLVQGESPTGDATLSSDPAATALQLAELLESAAADLRGQAAPPAEAPAPE